MTMNLRRASEKPKRRQLAALSGYRDWQLHDAKAHLSDLVRRARAEGPQRITVYGEDAVVVVSAAQFARMLAPSRRERSLRALLCDSPLRDLASARRASAVPCGMSGCEALAA